MTGAAANGPLKAVKRDGMGSRVLDDVYRLRGILWFFRSEPSATARAMAKIESQHHRLTDYLWVLLYTLASGSLSLIVFHYLSHHFVPVTTHSTSIPPANSHESAIWE